MKITRSHDETERRLRDALAAKAGGVEPSDGWGTIVGRLDGSPSVWTWITQHPLAIGAAAAVVALLAVLTVSLVTGDEQAGNVDTVDTPKGDEDTLIAIDTEGNLVELDLDGHQVREIGSLTSYTSANPFRLDGGVAVAGDGVFFLGAVATGDLTCPFVGPLPTDLWRYPLDLEPGVTLELGQFAQAAGAFGVSPDGERIAYAAAPDADRCNEPVVVVKDLASDEEIASYPIVGGLDVADVSWVSEDEVGITVVDGDSAAGLWRLELASDTSMTIPGTDPDLVVDVPTDLLIAPDANGQQILATGGAGNPFVDGDETYEAFENVHIWRGSVTESVAEPVAEIDAFAWRGIDPDANPGADVAPVELAALSLSAAADGSVYVTVADADHVEHSDSGVLVDAPEDVALFRVAPDGTVTKLGDGLLAVDVKPGDEPAPEPETSSEAGPVIGARPDGSLALLDPETGEVDEELWSDGAFAGPGQVFDEFGNPDAIDRLQDLAITPDGTRGLQTRGGVAADCAHEGEMAAPWDIWTFSLDPTDDNADPGGPYPLLGDPSLGPEDPLGGAIPSRLPAVSPDGAHMAYVTTSNGTRCDGAFVVAVASVDDPATPVATHTLPVGVEPVQLVWSDSSQLNIVLPIGEGDTPLVPVPVDPLVGGPVSADSSVSFPDTRVLAASNDDDYPFADAFIGSGQQVTVLLDDIYSDAVVIPPWYFQVVVGDSTRPAAVTVDGSGTIWLVVAVTEVDDLDAIVGYRSYRWSPDTPDDAAVQVSDEFVGVAASPFFPGDEVSPPDTTPTTEPTTSTTVTTPEGDAFVFLTWGGQIFRQTIGGEPELVAELGPNPNASGDVPGAGAVSDFWLAPTPDGRLVYLARPADPVDSCLSTLYSVSLDDGTVAEIGAGEAPAVSPDGSQLAYLERQPVAASGVCPTDLVVRDLTTGDERRWRDASSYGPDVLPPLDGLIWAPDSRTIIVERGTEDSAPFVADTDRPPGDLALSPLNLDGLAGLPNAPVNVSVLGVAEVDGRSAAIVDEWCYAESECRSPDVVYTVPLDGSPAPAGVAAPSVSSRAHASPAGILFAAACPVDAGADCYGFSVHYQSPTGEQTTLISENLVVALAWLP